MLDNFTPQVHIVELKSLSGSNKALSSAGSLSSESTVEEEMASRED